MKLYFSIIACSLAYLSYGQPHFAVKGRVTEAGSGKPLYKANLHLQGSDGLDILRQTDTNGYYYLDSNVVKANTSYFLKPEMQNFSWGGDTSFTTKGFSTSKTFTFNFQLKHVSSTISDNFIPAIRFAFKHTKLTKGNKDTALVYLVKLMDNNPTIVIELDGNSSQNEGDSAYKLILSQKRAAACRDYLVSQGIDSARIVIRGWGDTHPIVDDSTISTMKTKQEKEYAYSINRRCGFRVLRFDYIPTYRYNFQLLNTIINSETFSTWFQYGKGSDTISIIETDNYFNDTTYYNKDNNMVDLEYNPNRANFLMDTVLKKQKKLVVLFRVDRRDDDYILYFARPYSGASITFTLELKNKKAKIIKCDHGYF